MNKYFKEKKNKEKRFNFYKKILNTEFFYEKKFLKNFKRSLFKLFFLQKYTYYLQYLKMDHKNIKIFCQLLRYAELMKELVLIKNVLKLIMYVMVNLIAGIDLMNK